MGRKVLDGLLVVVILVGGVLAWQSGRERGRLSATFARLARTTGDLLVKDPSQVYVMALETGDPQHFAWRVYCPPNYRQVLSDHSGSGGTSWSSGSSEFIARVRFRENEEGVLEGYRSFGSTGGGMSSGDRSLADLLRGHWNEVRVEQLGTPDPAVLKPGQSALVLRLTLPDNLKEKALKTLPPDVRDRFVPVLLELNLGPKAPKP